MREIMCRKKALWRRGGREGGGGARGGGGGEMLMLRNHGFVETKLTEKTRPAQHGVNTQPFRPTPPMWKVISGGARRLVCEVL
jgi:hypothetical protein